MKSYNASNPSSLLVVILAAALSAGCGDSSTDPDPPSSEFDVQLTSTSSHGDVLADREGNALYLFTPDVRGESLCEGECIDNWPVFSAEQLQLGEGLDQGDFGSVTRSDGNSQTTYMGWPLYYYAGDGPPGSINGDGLNELWYVAKPGYTLMLATLQLVGQDGNNYRVDDGGNYVEGEEQTFYFVDSEGRTLYIFINDSANTNNYTNPDFSNDGTWPIFHTDIEALPSKMNEEHFGEITVHGQEQQLTYKGWPLYYFGSDTERGDTRGVSVPAPGVWPVVQAEMSGAPGYNSGNSGTGGDGNGDGNGNGDPGPNY